MDYNEKETTEKQNKKNRTRERNRNHKAQTLNFVKVVIFLNLSKAIITRDRTRETDKNKKNIFFCIFLNNSSSNHHKNKQPPRRKFYPLGTDIEKLLRWFLKIYPLGAGPRSSNHNHTATILDDLKKK